MQFKPSITNEDLNKLEIGSYSGKVIVITHPDDIFTAVQEIVMHTVIGFDTETKLLFVKGQFNEVSLVQIAIPNKVFLIRINKTGLTKELIDLFENENIKKLGVAIHEDFRELNKMREFTAAGIIELSKVVKEVGIEDNGLRKLTAIILGFRISKNSQVSNWEAKMLHQKQITYAATDAWVSLEMYYKLRKTGIQF